MMWLIARREYRTRTLAKANLISSAVIVVVIVGAALILKPFLSEGESEPDVIQVASGQTTALSPYLERSAAMQGVDVVVEEVDAPAEPAVADGSAALVTGDPANPTLYLDESDPTMTAVVQGAVQSAALDAQVIGLGGDPTVVAQALAEATVTVTLLGDASGMDTAEFFGGLIVIILLLIVLIQSASVIMMGVVEEKSSRVVEILLATVRPWTLLGGKILGVGMYSLTQAVTMFAPLLFAAWYLDLLSELGISASALVLNFSIWFVLGFALFAVFFGGLAALVSRQEDIGAVTTPMVFVMMVPMYVAMYLVPASPDGTVTAVLTQVPFFAPFMVPMRAAFGAISVAEYVLAIALCLAAIPVLTWVAGRIYAGAVLNTGGRTKIGEAFRRG